MDDLVEMYSKACRKMWKIDQVRVKLAVKCAAVFHSILSCVHVYACMCAPTFGQEFSLFVGSPVAKSSCHSRWQRAVRLLTLLNLG